MHEPVIVVWRATPDSRLIDVRAREDGAPELIERASVSERLIDDEKELLELIRSGSTERVAVPRDLAHKTFGWDL